MQNADQFSVESETDLTAEQPENAAIQPLDNYNTRAGFSQVMSSNAELNATDPVVEQAPADPVVEQVPAPFVNPVGVETKDSGVTVSTYTAQDQDNKKAITAAVRRDKKGKPLSVVVGDKTITKGIHALRDKSDAEIVAQITEGRVTLESAPEVPMTPPPVAPAVDPTAPVRTQTARNGDVLTSYDGGKTGEQVIIRRNSEGAPVQMTTRIPGQKVDFKALKKDYTGMSDQDVIAAIRPDFWTPSAAVEETNTDAQTDTNIDTEGLSPIFGGKTQRKKKSDPEFSEQDTPEETAEIQAAIAEMEAAVDAIADDAEIEAAIKAAEAADIDIDVAEDATAPETKTATKKQRKLKSEINSQQQSGKTPGKVSFPVQVFAAIRNKFLSPSSGAQVRMPKSALTDEAATAKWGKHIANIAAAARDVAFEMNTRGNAAGNAIRGVNIKRSTNYPQTDMADNAAARAKDKVASIDIGTRDLKRAIDRLTAAVVAADGNTKDVDAIVQVIKTRVQNPRTKDGKAPAKWTKLDVNLSRALGETKQGALEDNQFIRGTETRNSLETDKGEPTPFERAAKGEKNFKGDSVAEGITGIMRKLKKEGAPFEQMLAKALEKAFTAMGKNAPKLVFSKDVATGKDSPHYDPNTNTIAISRNSSPENALHEALHGALRWFVHNNPNHEAVVALEKSLEQVLAFKGLGGKALEVQTLLKDLAKESINDAILELISYGNTLNEFRRALDKMPTEGVNRNFLQAANDVWTNILNVVAEFLNIKQSVAGDVIQSTFKLLEQVANPIEQNDNTMTPKKGDKFFDLEQRAFHGTPYNFYKFLLAAIGTGEGNQAFGWGLYFAEKRKIGEHYKRTVGLKHVSTKFLSELPDNADIDEVMELVKEGKFTPQQAKVLRALHNDDWLGFDYPAQAISAVFRDMNNFDVSSELRDAVDNYGNLYQVDIPENSDLLDWDKPLSQQSKKVKELLAAMDYKSLSAAYQKRYANIVRMLESSRYNSKDYKPTGKDLVNALRTELRGQREASLYLNSLGIPGMRFRNGEGTGHNFVVWDDNLITIEMINDQKAEAQKILNEEAPKIIYANITSQSPVPTTPPPVGVPAYSADLAPHITNFDSAVVAIVKYASNPAQKEIAQKLAARLRQLKAVGFKFSLEITPEGYRLRGARGQSEISYSGLGEATTVKITLNHPSNGDQSGTGWVITAHELAHAATQAQIKYAPNGTAAVKLNSLFADVVKHFNRRAKEGNLTAFEKDILSRNNNALENSDELLAWGLTSEPMQRWLDSIKSKNGSFLSRLFDVVSSALGLSNNDTALSELMSIADGLLTDTVSTYTEVANKQGQSFGKQENTTGYPSWALSLALGRPIVWAEKDAALVQAQSLRGNKIYLVATKAGVSLIDVSGYEGDMLSPARLKEVQAVAVGLQKTSPNVDKTAQAKILYANITSQSPVPTTPPPVGVPAYIHYLSPESRSMLSSQGLFMALGWDKMVPGKVKELAAAVAKGIRKDFPGLERILSNINASFSISEEVLNYNRNYKYDKNTANQYVEMVATKIERRDAAYNQAVMDYLDGDKTALKNIDDDALPSQLSYILKFREQFIDELPVKEQGYFRDNKFSETLIYALESKNVSSSSLSAQGVLKYVGMKTETETDLSNSAPYMKTNAQGDLDIGDMFYQVFQPSALGLVKFGYISRDKFTKDGPPIGKDGLPMAVDKTRVWVLNSKSKPKNKPEYIFKSNMTSAQAIKELESVDRANALRNTMAAMAVNYAARNYARGMASLGYVDGKPTASSVVFDDVAQIEKVFGVKIDPDKILSIAANEAENAKVRGKYRASNTWVRIPTQDGNGERGYGPMAGKIVPGPVWNAMNDMNDRHPIVKSRAYNALLALFKKSKTTWNPGTHVTNTLTNFSLAYMHDISYKQLRDAARIYSLYHTNPKKLAADEKQNGIKNGMQIMNDFINSGAMLSDYSIAEVKNNIFNAFDGVNDPRAGDSMFDRLAMFAKYEKLKQDASKTAAYRTAEKWADVPGQTYAAEDNIFRLAGFLKKMSEMESEGRTREQSIRAAGQEARNMFLDYDIDSRAVKIARQTFFPFVAWTYGIVPLLGRMAMYKPWKLVNLMAAFQLTGMALAAAAGDDDEQRDAGPEFLKDRMFLKGPYMHMRIPFLGDDENPVYWRIGDAYPMASSLKGLPNGAFGIDGLPQVLTPSNPIATMMMAFLGGVDPYTGDSIYEAADTTLDKIVTNALEAYDIMMPPMISVSNAKQVKGLAIGRTGITGAPTSPYVIARVFGLRLYQHNVDEQAEFKDIDESNIRRDFSTAINKAKREAVRNGSDDYEALDKELDKLEERMNRKLAEARGEDYVE
jgi:hypothetical protein